VALADFTAPTYTVDLDLPPRQRWQAAVQEVLTVHGFENSYGPLLGSITSFLPAPVLKIMEPILDVLDSAMGDFGQEILGIFEVFQQQGLDKSANVTLGDLVAMNIVYELTAFCTSVTAQNTNGTIFHGRNLDYNFPGLPNVTYTTTFISNGTVQYMGTAFIGYVGLLTGMRPHAWSVSVDERDQTGNATGLIENVVSFVEGGKSIGMFLRETLATHSQFADVINVLNTTRLVAPVYLIVSGVNPGEGAVITRDRNHADDSQGVQNGVWTLAPPSAWWRLETNYDHWMAPPSNDDRRDPGNKMMAAIGPDAVSTDTLFAMLSTAPVLNSNTIYTATMCPATGFYATTVRV